MREAFFGRRKFEEFQSSLGIPRAVLAARLDRLVDEAMLVRLQYQDHPPRDEYRLTEKGRAFWEVLAAMWRWGSDWLWDEAGPPVVLKDRTTGSVVRPRVVDERTGEPVDLRRVRVGRSPQR